MLEAAIDNAPRAFFGPHSREWRAEEDRLVVYDDKNQRQEIPYASITKIRQRGSVKPRIEIVTSDNKLSFAVSPGKSRSQMQVLDTLASRVPFRAELEMDWSARSRGEVSRWAMLLFSSSLLAGRLWQFAAEKGLPLGVRAALAGALVAAAVIFKLVMDRRRKQAQPSEPDSKPLTRQTWAEMRQPGIPALTPEREMMYIPRAPGTLPTSEPLFFLLFGPFFLFVLGIGLNDLVLMLGSLGLMAILCALGVFRQRRIAQRENDRFVLGSDGWVELTRRGKTYRAPADSRVSKPGLYNGASFFAQYDEYTGPEGKFQIDSRYAWPADLPLYEPESPWEDLWREHGQSLIRSDTESTGNN